MDLPFNKLIIPASVQKINSYMFGSSTRDTQINELILNCSPMVLTTSCYYWSDWWVCDTTINSIVFNNYQGEMPLDFLLYQDSLCEVVLNGPLYVPSEYVTTATTQYNNAYNTNFSVTNNETGSIPRLSILAIPTN